MNVVRGQTGRWEVECIPADGARLSLLRFGGRDLLTRAPERFKPPTRDFGAYETRPVYGYDACLPSVEPCSVPEAGWQHIPDHGEVCWLPWDVNWAESRLECSARSNGVPALRFRRSLIFAESSVRACDGIAVSSHLFRLGRMV
ncbi:MAG: hypothetical protein KKB50_14825 [Planctomycetes bacterium]|nr:hypothetical protein [Planctomycetota bacterium]